MDSLDPKNLDKFKKEMKNILKNAQEVNQSFSNWGNEFEKIKDLSDAIKDKQAAIKRLTGQLYDEQGNINEEVQAQLNYEKEKLKLLNTTVKTLKRQVSLTRTLGNEALGFLAKQTKLLTGMRDMYYDIDESVRKTSMSLGLSANRMAKFQQSAMGAAGTYAALGLDVKEAAQAQANYSDEVGRTVMLSTESLKRMGKLGKVTGMGVDGISQMAGQMEAFGMGSTVAMDNIVSIRDTAQGMGINTGKVLKKVQQNMGLLNKINFKGGVKGLGKMAAYSEKFKMDMDALANSAQAVWSPEGAIEAASSLQTLGGGFSKLADPFKLMFDARNDPEKYAESITKSLSGIAKFKDGEFIVSTYEMQRLKEAGEALGFSQEQMVEMAKQQAKMEKIGGGLTMFSDPKERAMLEGMIEFDAKGRPMIGDKTLKELKANNAEGLKLLLEGKAADEEAAKNAMSTREMFNVLGNQLMSSLLPIMKALDPILRQIVTVVSDFIQNNPITSAFITGAGIIVGKMAEWYAKGYQMGIGFNRATSGGGGLLEKLKFWKKKSGGGETSAVSPQSINEKANDTSNKASKATKGGGVGDSLKSLAKGLTAMGTPQVLFGAANLIPTALGMVAMLPALPTLALLGNVPMKSLYKNISAMGRGLEKMGTPIVSLGAANLALAALGFTLMTAGAIGLAAIAIGGIAAGAGLSALATGLTALGNPATAGFAAIGVLLLMGVGAAMMMFGAAIYFVAAGIALIVDSFTNMFSVINADNIGALMLLGPALMLTSLGIMSLAGSLLVMAGAMALGGWLGLLGLAAAADTVKEAFQGIDADGITKSVEAINNVDLEKIQALKELSQAMSLWGILGAKPIVVSLEASGQISLGGPGGESFDISQLSEQQLSELKDLIFQKQKIDTTGGV